MPASLVLEHAQEIGNRWGGPYGSVPNIAQDFLPPFFPGPVGMVWQHDRIVPERNTIFRSFTRVLSGLT